VFVDRADAGRQLAAHLARSKPSGKLLVLGLPRGGLPVAAAVAEALDAPLDVLVVRKIGAPFNPELAVGAIALGGIAVFNESLIASLRLTEESLESVRKKEQKELERRELAYRGNRSQPAIEGTTVFLVDDGIATGATMYAAAQAVRKLGPERLIVAVPTCSVEARHWLLEVADEVIALAVPDPYIAVGVWYQRFEQLDDVEVVEILDRARNTEDSRA